MDDYTSPSFKQRIARQLTSLFSQYDGPGFSVRLWSGFQWISSRQPVACTLVINSPHALAVLAGASDEVSLGGAFIAKDLDVEGDLFAAFSVATHLMARPRNLRQRALESILAGASNLGRWLRHGPRHSQKRDLASISYHYDLPVEFYRPWLGQTLVYSCAYFRGVDDSLDKAQAQKLDLICRKLRLKEHESFLDIGCGWGSLVLHAAGRYRAQAHGITLSSEQAKVARQRIAGAGLVDWCSVEHRDYRRCGELHESFDKIASIGMFEHVGLPNLPVYFASVRQMLKPGGTFLNHGIARSASSPSSANTFIDRYVFPDGKLVTITEAINAAENAGFEVRGLENLREHYVLTLRRWVQGLYRNKEALLKIVPEITYRIWLLYTAGSAVAFERGQISVNQVLLSRLDHGQSRLPLTRDDWYANVEEQSAVAPSRVASAVSRRSLILSAKAEVV